MKISDHWMNNQGVKAKAGQYALGFTVISKTRSSMVSAGKESHRGYFPFR